MISSCNSSRWCKSGGEYCCCKSEVRGETSKTETEIYLPHAWNVNERIAWAAALLRYRLMADHWWGSLISRRTIADICVGMGSKERSQSAKTGSDIINVLSLGGGSLDSGGRLVEYLAEPPI